MALCARRHYTDLAKKRKSRTAPLRGSELRAYRSNLAKLKRSGLINKSYNVRGAQPTRHMVNQIDRYKDVLEDRAKVVPMPTRKLAHEFERAKFNKVVVDAPKDATARWSDRRGAIVIKRKTKIPGIGTNDELIFPDKDTEIPALKPGEKYAIKYRSNGSTIYRTFSTEDFLREFLMRYDKFGTKATDIRSNISIIGAV
jgi:hypothetical protein